MMIKVLCVAEKPSIAKSVARILSKDGYQTKNTKSKYIKNYEFEYNFLGEDCQVVMTSVTGHVTEIDFPKEYRSWRDCRPELLFNADIVRAPREDVKAIVENLKSQSRNSRYLFIWTDCDREGENIGAEIMNICHSVNPRLIVKRAKFSVIQPREIREAWSNSMNLDMKQVDAVDARMELDLRIGAAFTRLQTMCLQGRFQILAKKVLSYGPCQFPTLGFVVDQFIKANNFIPENFWGISLTINKDEEQANFNWSRGHIFDKDCCQAIYDILTDTNEAVVTKVTSKPTEKWRPLPLTTVELQKSGSIILKISSDKMMQIAEKLYNEGYISYPRTETDVFDKNFDLHSLVQKQAQDPRWGEYASDLMNGKFRRPRNGKHDDKAHPPIHPTRDGQNLQSDERRVHEFVTRRFLACCSENAKGHSTNVEVKVDEETFSASGLTVLERNYLDVYIYEKWSGHTIPYFEINERISPIKLKMNAGKTTAPNLLTEADLITLMDKSGIGTDATIHEHIKKILDREYVEKERGIYFCPTVLGVALIEAYDAMDMSFSLSKPDLRSQMELNMKGITEGRMNKETVVKDAIMKYKSAFQTASAMSSCFIEKFQVHFGQEPDRVAEERENQTAVMNCQSCQQQMVYKQLKEHRLIGCNGYPACKECIFIPSWVSSIQISTRKCSICDAFLCAFTFPPNKLPPSFLDQYEACIRCDGELRAQFSFYGNDRINNVNNNNTNHDNHSSFPASYLTKDSNTHDSTSNSRKQERSFEDSNGPFCPCQQPSVKKKVRKEGANIGREFYGCYKGMDGCGYFQWADEIGISSGNNSVVMESNNGFTSNGDHQGNISSNSNYNNQFTTNTPLRRQQSFGNQEHAYQNQIQADNNDNQVKCECGLIASLKTVCKDGPNKGRQFYTCVKSSSRCSFFQWFDQQDEGNHNMMNGYDAGSSSNNGGQVGTCFKCGEHGHFANACPDTENGKSSNSRRGSSSTKRSYTSKRGGATGRKSITTSRGGSRGRGSRGKKKPSALSIRST